MACELKVGIIGAGYAGMAAAATLAARGIPVTVFEGAQTLGGRARGVTAHNMQLDNGQHILLGCYRETLKLIELVGGNVERDFLRLPLQLTLHRRFQLKLPALPTPLHLLAGLASARGLTVGERINAARFMRAMQRMNFTLPQDMAACDFLRAHGQGENIVRLLWEPVCIAALNTPVRDASAQILLNVLSDSFNGARSNSDMLLPRIDFTALFPARAAAYVRQRGGEIKTSATVESMSPQENGIELAGTTGTQRFTHVICAASPAQAGRLVRTVPGLAGIAAQVESLAYQPIYTAYLKYPDSVRLPQPMLGLDGCLAQWLFDRGQIAGQHGLIAAVISAKGVHEELEHEALAGKIEQELKSQLGIHETPLCKRVIAEKRATFSCTPNLARPSAETPLPNLLLAGDYTAGKYPATLEAAVASGVRSAEKLLRQAAASQGGPCNA